MSNDKPKKSWREIDAARDRAGGSRPTSIPSKLREQQKSKQHRAALDALFEQGGFSKVAEILGKPLEPSPAVPAPPIAPAAPPDADPSTRAELRSRILAAIGRDELSRAVDKYRAKFALPEDWEVLEQALEHRDKERVDEVLAKLEKLLERERPRRARTLIGKLRYLEETTAIAEQQRRAAALRSKLS